MARSVQDFARGGRDTGAVDVRCPECDHDLWAEQMPVADRFGVWVCFDDEEQSDTYAEQVGRCPGCGAWLNAQALSLSVAHEKVRTG
jgi:predicted AAA+ superfamily ATPase